MIFNHRLYFIPFFHPFSDNEISKALSKQKNIEVSSKKIKWHCKEMTWLKNLDEDNELY